MFMFTKILGQLGRSQTSFERNKLMIKTEGSNSSLIKASAAVFLIVLAGCSKTMVQDGPPSKFVDVSTIPDAIPSPIQVPLKNTPYTHDGIDYNPMGSASGYSENGLASWYGTKFHGKQTANGEIYDMYKMTAAHKTLPLPSYVKVTNIDNGQSVVVRVNDRGPFHGDRLIDLSYVAAKKIGFADSGLANVVIEGIDPHVFSQSPVHKRDDDLLYLQLAALKNYHSAQMLRRDIFAKAGVQAKVVKGDEPETLYRVRIGPIESPDHLEGLLEKLNTSEFEPPYLVYIKPNSKNQTSGKGVIKAEAEQINQKTVHE